MFLTRIFALGWQWDSDGWIIDHSGFRLHLLNSPVQLLEQRIEDAWLRRVATSVAVREGFAGLEHCDFSLSTGAFSQHDFEHQGLLRTVMNGSFFTRNKQLASGNFVDSSCPWCECIDSIRHRHWECPYFQDVRDRFPKESFAKLDSLDPCTIEHGWFTYHPALEQFRQCLNSAPDMSNSFLCQEVQAESIHLFTDRSCLAPALPTLCLASWGVVCADFQSSDPVFLEVAKGPLPGFLQTIFRAEAVAAIAALRFGNRNKKPFWIWVDNQLVFDLLKSCILREPPAVTQQDKDHDLKQALITLAKSSVSKGWWQDVVKVSSHQDPVQISSLVEAWAFAGNDAADRCAADGRSFFPEGIYTIWEVLMEHHRQSIQLRDDLHRHFIWVGAKAVACKQALRQQEATRWAEVDNIGEEVQPDFSESDGETAKDLPLTTLNIAPHEVVLNPIFGTFGRDIYNWLWTTVNSPEGKPSWISNHQLLLFYQTMTGQVGVRKTSDRGWEQLQLSDVDELDFCKAASDFSSYVRAILKSLGSRIHTSKRRPSGVAYRKWLCCMHLMIPKDIILATDNLLMVSRVAPILYVQKSFREFRGAFSGDGTRTWTFLDSHSLRLSGCDWTSTEGEGNLLIPGKSGLVKSWRRGGIRGKVGEIL